MLVMMGDAVPYAQRSDNSLCNLTSAGDVMDQLDATLLHLFADEPRIGVLEASRRLGVARGTVQARLDKLSSSGVISGWGPQVEPEALGHPVTAFLTLEIRQGGGVREDADRGGHQSVAAHLARIPEVLEAFTITGAGDMWARVVARSNSDLQRVIDAVLADPGIVRSSTVIALATQIPHRVLPLVDATVASR
jgi:DNA-binding Lrp family transcriptional regulator